MNIVADESLSTIEAWLKSASTSDRINEQGTKIGTPLLCAIAFRDKDTVERLLSHGADPNLRDKYGNPALKEAINRKDKEIIECLLANNADPNLEDNYGCRALDSAILSRDVALARMLLVYGANPNFGYYPPVIAAAVSGEEEIVELLLAHGADPNIRDAEDGWTPLFAVTHAERHNDSHTIVERLLVGGADPNLTDPDGYTPLFCAARNGNTLSIEHLLAHGADPNRTTSDGETALMAAAEGDVETAVDRLLAAGADPNIKRADGWTALAGAAHVGAENPAIAEQLIMHGADSIWTREHLQRIAHSGPGYARIYRQFIKLLESKRIKRYLKMMQNKAALLRAVAKHFGLPVEVVEEALEEAAVKAARETTARATAQPHPAQSDTETGVGQSIETAGRAPGKLARQEIRKRRDEARLDGLLSECELQIDKLVLPPDGFTTKSDADAAARLATTVREVQKLQRKLGRTPMEMPEGVRIGEAMASAYRRSHDKETGKLITPSGRPGGRPRRWTVQARS
jgi:ankyrin repeat protein